MKANSPYFLLSVILLSGSMLTTHNLLPLFPTAQAQTFSSNYTDNQLQQWLKNVGNQMVSIVNSNLSRHEQKQKFLVILDKYVDVNNIGQFCLGRFWRLATPDQQKQYLYLFHQVLINSITNRLGEYKGVSFQIGKVTTIENNRKSVESIIRRPGQPVVSVQWILSTQSGFPRVVDIVGENASLSMTQRGDYTSFIARNGNKIEPLIQALERQISRQN